MIREGIAYVKDGNCFPWIADPLRAQELFDQQLRTDWPATLDGLLRRNCPSVGRALGVELAHYWSADETEWATDVMFRSTRDLDALFPSLLRYLLVLLMVRRIRQAGLKHSPRQLLDLLEQVRLASYVETRGPGRPGRPAVMTRLEDCDEETMRLFRLFVVEETTC